ncbi:hypothetical protein [Crossiella sp. CA198]|uniref:hypothetical protein n=1 Tax=Crossiella sp. CA198 TaxID=3455607 RepID=UPI003F8D5117
MQNTTVNTELDALGRHVEEMCGRYLEAHKSMRTLAGIAASWTLLVRQQPTRMDYRKALRRARADVAVATDRAERAWEIYQAAAHRADAVWTATVGRAA